MNIFFKIDGKVVTPMLNGSILPGITRDSVLRICRDWGLPTEERRISVEELLQAQKEGKLEEVFGTGTAAVISPVGKLRYKDDVMVIGDNKHGPLSQSTMTPSPASSWAAWKTSTAGGSRWTDRPPTPEGWADLAGGSGWAPRRVSPATWSPARSRAGDPGFL